MWCLRRTCGTISAVVGRACKHAWVLALLSGVSTLPACHRRPHGDGASNASAPLAPLAAAAWLVDLDVPGFGSAALAVPLAATQPRSVVVALHGSADRPEWSCGAFRGIAGPSPFVLCPRGIRRADSGDSDVRYTFGTADDTSRELRVALGELKRKFGRYVAAGPITFCGFELGADHAAWIAREEPAFFARVLLIEPAEGTWPTSQAALFGHQGGIRSLFAGSASDQDSLELKALLTRRSGAEATAVRLVEGGLGPANVRRLAQSWSWLAAPTKLRAVENLAGNGLPANRPSAISTVK